MESDSGVAGLNSTSELYNTAADQHSGCKRQDTTTEKSAMPPSKNAFRQLEERVGRVERQLTDLNSLPSTKELLLESGGGQERQGGSSSSRPVADMWQGMQLSRKVDANTQGVSKVRITEFCMNYVDCTTREFSTLPIGGVYTPNFCLTPRRSLLIVIAPLAHSGEY